MKRILLPVLLLCLPVAGFAGDSFKQIVKTIEHEYGVRHTGIPWYARMMMKPAMVGSGVSGLKVAEFENVSFRHEGAPERIARVVEQVIGPEWQRVIRVRSRRDKETTYIYFRPQGARFTMLIVSAEADEGAVVQMTINEREFEKWARNTEVMAKSQVRHRGQTAPETASLVTPETPGGYAILVP